MKLLLVIAAVLAAVAAQEFYDYEPQQYTDNSEAQYRLDQLRKQRDHKRRPRDVTLTHSLGPDGKIVGVLGNTPSGKLFGQAGYEHTLMNGDAGKLTAQGYGTRVLGPNRDSTHFGGKLNWADSNSMASMDISKRIGGRSRMDFEAGGRWEPFRNTEVTAGGYYTHRQGRPADYGGRGNIIYRF